MEVIIYEYTNKITNKKYIGQTINEYQRKQNHKSEALKRGSQYYFHRSIRKHGWEAFEYTVIDKVSEDKAIEVETKHIIEKNTIWPNGYNEQIPTNRMTESVRKKISESNKKRMANRTPEQIERHKEISRTAHKGKKQTEKQKERATQANGKWWLITYPDGREEKVFNLRKFGKENNVDQGNLSKYGKSKGFKAVLIDPNK